jgi:hypothetical protein
MKLLKQLNDNAKTQALAEDAAGGAVGGGAMGIVAMPLFSSLVKNTKPGTSIKPIPGPYAGKKSKKKGIFGLKEAFDSAMGGQGMGDAAGGAKPALDTTEVMAKLKGLEQKEKVDHRDTVSFGLEDDNGATVRVTVKRDQAEDFEKALQSMMASFEEEDETVPEIAEVLFKLKDQFDIVDVKWPEIAEDEEEDQAVAGGEQADPGGEGDLGDPNDPNAGGDMDLGEPEPAAGGDADAAGLLTQVIDMMKADAEARKAEARAREAEAKGKEANAIVAQTMARVKQEEQYLDMDSYNKAKKEESKEAKRLAQLAKWKHDLARDSGDSLDDDTDGADMPLVPNRETAPEEEERTYRTPSRVPHTQVAQPKKVAPAKGRVHPYDIAEFIIGRVK